MVTDEMLEEFKAEFKKLSPKNKEIMMNSPWITSEEQAKSYLQLMKFMNAMDYLMKEKEVK